MGDLLLWPFHLSAIFEFDMLDDCEAPCLRGGNNCTNALPRLRWGVNSPSFTPMSVLALRADQLRGLPRRTSVDRGQDRGAREAAQPGGSREVWQVHV